MKRLCCFKILGGLVIIFLMTIPTLNAATHNPEMPAADALLESPDLDLAMAEKAMNLYQGMLSSDCAPRPMVLAQLARTCFILGDLASKGQRESYYQKGQGYAHLLVQEYPHRAEGHYWLALNLCGQADAAGYMVGRRLLPQIIEALKRSLVLSQTYDQAGAHRILGRIYFQAPAWPMSVGDMQKSLHHLQAAVRLAPDNSTNHLYLAQTLANLHYRSLAQQQLEIVLKCTQHAVKPQEVEEDRKEARRLLAEMGVLPLP